MIMIAENHCCGSDFALILVGWIRIRIGDADSDPGPRGQMTPKNRKKFHFIFCSAGCSLFTAEGFSCGLDVLYGG
jgi:hypothetical protein